MRLTEKIDLPVAPARAWRAMTNTTVLARGLPGLERLEMLDDGPLGPGSRLQTTLRVGAERLSGVLEVKEFRDGREMRLEGGVDGAVTVGVRVRSEGDGARISVRIDYHARRGLPGAVAEHVARPELRRRVRALLRAVSRLLLDEEAPPRGSGPVALVTQVVRSFHVYARTGTLRPMRPDKYLAIAQCFVQWGATPAGAYAAAAVRDPHRLAIIDDHRALTYAELDTRTTALAVALRDRGVRDGQCVGIACRNHRGFVEALIGVSKSGADALLLNTAFAVPQVQAIVARERPTALICDGDLLATIDEGWAPPDGAGSPADPPLRVVTTEHGPWGRRATEDPEQTAARPSGVRSLDELIAEGAGRKLSPPRSPGRVTLLTSGTTGDPKGIARRRISFEAPISFLDRLPYRDGATFFIAPPLFHAWGYANLLMAMLLGGTVVLQEHVEPESALQAMARHSVDVLVAVPVLLRRILDLEVPVRKRYEPLPLQITAVSGAALPADLATRWMDAFGEGLHNVYGATEVGWGTIADPADLRAAPGTAGRVPLGAEVRIFDGEGVPMPPGEHGYIHVGGDLAREEYTDGSRLRRRDGLAETGDIGYFDRQGRLFVLGREDDMIVSRGENIHPRAVEDVLAAHPAVRDVAAVGVEDVAAGQRVAVYVVRRPDAELSEDDVRELVRAARPRFEVPRDVHFRDELPRGSTGKLLTQALAGA